MSDKLHTPKLPIHSANTFSSWFLAKSQIPLTIVTCNGNEDLVTRHFRKLVTALCWSIKRLKS